MEAVFCLHLPFLHLIPLLLLSFRHQKHVCFACVCLPLALNLNEHLFQMLPNLPGNFPHRTCVPPRVVLAQAPSSPLSGNDTQYEPGGIEGRGRRGWRSGRAAGQDARAGGAEPEPGGVDL